MGIAVEHEYKIELLNIDTNIWDSDFFQARIICDTEGHALEHARDFMLDNMMLTDEYIDRLIIRAVEIEN